jgi:ABC-type Zn2+ transport system substrate-binding protein/surface adhesin
VHTGSLGTGNFANDDDDDDGDDGDDDEDDYDQNHDYDHIYDYDDDCDYDYDDFGDYEVVVSVKMAMIKMVSTADLLSQLLIKRHSFCFSRSMFPTSLCPTCTRGSKRGRPKSTT